MTPRHLLEPGRIAGAAILSAQSDERLVDMVQDGNDRAFEVIVARHKGPLLRYCSRILPDGRGDDALQQTFLNAYDALRRGATPLSLRSWLFGIAHNTALNILRQRQTAPQQADGHVQAVEPAHDTLERRERFREVMAAIAALPPSQRDALLLRELEGRGHEEIARELGVTGGAARQLISRARDTVRRMAAAMLPFPLLMRLTADGAPSPSPQRVAELTAVGGGATVAKVVATAAVGGTLLGGAVTKSDLFKGHRDLKRPEVAEAASPGRDGDRRIDLEPSQASQDSDRSGPERPSARSGPGAGGDFDDNSGPGSEDDSEDDFEDNSGPGSEDDHEDDFEDNSGPGSEDDHEDDSEDDFEDNSGPGSGDDSDWLDALEPDHDTVDADGVDDDSDNSGPGGDGD